MTVHVRMCEVVSKARVEERERVIGTPDAATLYSRRHQNLIIILDRHSEHVAIKPGFQTPVTDRGCRVACARCGDSSALNESENAETLVRMRATIQLFFFIHSIYTIVLFFISFPSIPFFFFFFCSGFLPY